MSSVQEQIAFHEAGHAVVAVLLGLRMIKPVRIDLRKIRAGWFQPRFRLKTGTRYRLFVEWAVKLVAVHAAGTLAEEIHGFQPSPEWFEGKGEEYTDKSQIQGYALMGSA